jgi:hypothetical protein
MEEAEDSKTNEIKVSASGINSLGRAHTIRIRLVFTAISIVVAAVFSSLAI